MSLGEEESRQQAGAHPLERGRADDLADLFKTLGDATRLQIISLLAGNELCVSDIAASLGMSVSAVSHQLHLLRRMRLVRWRREGREIYYALDDEHVRTLYETGLDHAQHG